VAPNPFASSKQKAKGRRPSPPVELSPPLVKSVSDAYRTYSKDEWKDLITKLDHAALRPLLLYLRDNKDQLTRAEVDQDDIAQDEPGDLIRHVSERATAPWVKYGAVFETAAKRSMILLFSRGGDWKVTPISDTPWAALWNKVGAPPTSKKRTPAELHGPRAIAEALGYDPDNMHKQVAEWLERMEELPFEEFVERYGGDLSDYLTWVRSPRLHNKIQSLPAKRHGD
jgi:hypothetical protein